MRTKNPWVLAALFVIPGVALPSPLEAEIGVPAHGSRVAVPAWSEDAGWETLPDEDQIALLRRKLEPVFREALPDSGPRGVSISLETGFRSSALSNLSWDSLDSRARLSISAAGRFRFYASGLRKKGEGPFPDASKIAFAWDGFAPRWQLFAGDLNIRLGSGLLFSTSSPPVGSRDQRRLGADFSSRMDADASTRETALRGGGLAWCDGNWAVGVFAATMSLDATIQQGSLVNEFPVITTLDTIPSVHDSDSARARKGAATEVLTGFYATWRRRGFQVDLGALREELDKPLLPSGASSDPDALLGSKLGGICLSLTQEAPGLKWALASALSIRPGVPETMELSGVLASDPARFDPAFQVKVEGKHEDGRFSLGGQWLSPGFSVLHGAAPGMHRPAEKEWFAWAQAGKNLASGFDLSANIGAEGDSVPGVDGLPAFRANLWIESSFSRSARFRTVFRLGAGSSNSTGVWFPKLDGRAEWRGSKILFRLTGLLLGADTNAPRGSLSAKAAWRPGKKLEARLSAWALSGVQGMEIDTGNWVSTTFASSLTLRGSVRLVFNPIPVLELGASYSGTGVPGNPMNHAAALSVATRAEW